MNDKNILFKFIKFIRANIDKLNKKFIKRNNNNIKNDKK